jgi:hypothetical protein
MWATPAGGKAQCINVPRRGTIERKQSILTDDAQWIRAQPSPHLRIEHPEPRPTQLRVVIGDLSEQPKRGDPYLRDFGGATGSNLQSERASHEPSARKNTCASVRSSSSVR